MNVLEAFPQMGRLFAYWQKLANGRAPDRSLFDPLAVPGILPYLIIVDFEFTPFRVKYRLSGTTVDEMTGMNITGHYLDSFAKGAYEEVILEIQSYYEAVARTGEPYVGSYKWPADESCSIVREVPVLMLPLLVDGAVSQAVSIEEYNVDVVRTRPINWSLALQSDD